MRTRRQLFTDALAAGSGLLVLGACGSNDSGGPRKAKAAPTTSSSALPDRGDADLVIWTDAQRAPVLKPFADSFGRENGITVAVQPVSTDLQTGFVTATNAGKGPDIVVGATDWIGNLVQNGTIAPVALSDAQKSAFTPTAAKAVTYTGQTYGVPYATENVALFRNTALATGAPATFEQLVKTGKALVSAKKVKRPLAVQVGEAGDAYHMEPFYTSAGGYLFGTKANGDYDPSDLGIGKAGSLAFAKLLHQYGEKGEGVFTRSIDADNAISLFGDGKVPFLVSGEWAIPQVKQADVRYAISAVPGFAGMGPSRPFIGTQAFYQSTKAKNTALAQEFMVNYLTRASVEKALYTVEPRRRR